MTIRKILLIDDEADLRRIGALSLRNVGKWEVLLADSGTAALELLQTERPDVVLLDVMMPGLDGPATLAKLRELPNGCELPVIFMTALSEPEEHERLMTLGAKGIIVKPFAPLMLPQQVRRFFA